MFLGCSQSSRSAFISRYCRYLSKSRLRQLAEDAMLISGNTSSGDQSLDPTVLVAEHKITEAMRRGVFDNLENAGKALADDAHRDLQSGRIEKTNYIMTSQLAGANVKPLSIELSNECEEKRQEIIRRIQAMPMTERRSSPVYEKLSQAADELNVLIKKQHFAAIADVHAFSVNSSPLQVSKFDLELEIDRLNNDT